MSRPEGSPPVPDTVDGAGQDMLSDEMRVFVSRVHDRVRDADHDAEGDSAIDAEVLARATVRALGAELTPTQGQHVTSGLPEELATELLAHVTDVPGGFDEDAFLDRVTRGGGGDREVVGGRVRDVLTVLRGWAPPGPLEDAPARFPVPLARMFACGRRSG